MVSRVKLSASQLRRRERDPDVKSACARIRNLKAREKVRRGESQKRTPSYVRRRRTDGGRKRRVDARRSAGEKENESRERWKKGEIEKDCSFTAERQRESFSLKAPFCPGAVFRSESNLPCRALRYVYLSTRVQRTGKKRLQTRYVSRTR